MSIKTKYGTASIDSNGKHQSISSTNLKKLEKKVREKELEWRKL